MLALLPAFQVSFDAMTTADGDPDLEEIERFGADPTLAMLDAYVPTLKFARVFGFERDERSHSKMLATLLDLETCLCAKTMLDELLRALSTRAQGLYSTHSAALHQLRSTSWNRVSVYRELFNIDIVVDIDSASGGAIIGIENKIDAGEEEDQIRRYQKALQQAYPGRVTLMVFLTPTGRLPTTADIDSATPCLSIGYDAILQIIRNLCDHTAMDARDHRVLTEIATHLEEDILGSSNDIKTLVRELWRNHPRALTVAMAYRPRMGDIESQYREIITEKLGTDATFSTYPTRGELREIKLQLKSWCNRGFPFVFMLYASADEPPHVRVFISDHDYGHCAANLTRWAKRVNSGKHGIAIDESFTLLKDWKHWRRVLAEQDHPANATLAERAFDIETARSAANRVLGLINVLREHVDSSV